MSDPGPVLMRGLLEVFILERLREAPQHGYALLKEMGSRFGSEPNRNKIYPLLARLEKQGLVEAVPDPADDRGRTAYALTDQGREALAQYRQLPDGFYESLRRVWGDEAPAAPRSAPAAEEQAPPEDETAATPDAPTPTAATEPSPDVTPAPSRPAGGSPYPCPDARVTVERTPRSGDVTLRLTGCPMGAYDYCPQCPVYKGMEGVRRFTFG